MEGAGSVNTQQRVWYGVGPCDHRLKGEPVPAGLNTENKGEVLFQYDGNI